jgi:hypothetical protein
MAYIPSAGLADVLEKAAIGLWIEHLHDGRDAFVCKVPETVSKAVYRRVPCVFLPTIVPTAGRNVLCLGLKVFDEPDHPLTAVSATMTESHVAALKRILASRSTSLHFLNELNHPVLSASCALDGAAAQLALDRLSADAPYMDDSDEGAKLEGSLQVAIDSIYPGSTFRSPTVCSGASQREFTDLLAFDVESICLVEAKAVAVLRADLGRRSGRRAATLKKHMTKAVRQLGGALAKLRSTIDINDAAGQRIAIPNRDTSPAHAIVVLSEMYAFLDWRSIARELVDASEDPRHRALFHVLDFTELGSVVRASQNAPSFHRVPVQRWLQLKMKGTAYGRVTTLHDCRGWGTGHRRG